MSCETALTGVGVGLLGESLMGSGYFVFDTQQYNALIKTVEYTTNDYDTLSSSISATLAVTNYKCDLDDDNNFYIMYSNPETLNLSGRYVGFKFDVSRDSVDVYSPRIYDIKVDFTHEQIDSEYKAIYKMKSDIFGFEYALLKDDLNVDNYSYKLLDGEVVVKNLSDKVIPLNELIPSSYLKYQYYEDSHPNMFYEMTSGVKDFEVFYDTLMFVTSSYIVIEKCNFNFSDNEFSVDETNFRVINLNALSAVYSDVWFFEDANEIFIFVMQSLGVVDELILNPKCFRLNLVNGNFEDVVIEDADSLLELESLNINRIEAPVVAYDRLRNNFNLGVTFYNDVNNYYILSMNLEYDLEKLIFKGFDVISPVDYSGV